MSRLNRTWIGLALVTLGYRVLPKRIRDERELTLRLRQYEVPHAIDISRFQPDPDGEVTGR